jgi:large subunit ribosomal protein L1
MPKIPKKRGEAESGRRIPRRRGSRIKQARSLVERSNFYPLDEALSILQKPEMLTTRFDQTVSVALQLGVDPRKSDQMVRGAVVLPHGTGKTVRVLVFAKGEKEIEAREAGADIVGGEELVDKIQQENWLEFDKAIATPDMMRHVGRIGKLLGPRSLMPSPKVGTVTFDIANAVRETKAGKIEFRVEKAGIVHAPLGKISFGAEKLRDNLFALLDIVVRLKPSTSKGVYLRKATLSLTQSPGIRLDVAELQVLLKK